MIVVMVIMSEMETVMEQKKEFSNNVSSETI